MRRLPKYNNIVLVLLCENNDGNSQDDIRDHTCGGKAPPRYGLDSLALLFRVIGFLRRLIFLTSHVRAARQLVGMPPIVVRLRHLQKYRFSCVKLP
jgi:hypothetical protein